MEELKFKKLKKSNKKNIIIGAIALVAITSAVTYLGTRAKYQTIDSIPLARGTVRYNIPDLEVIAVLQETDDSSEAFVTKGSGANTKYYKKATSIPSSGFTLNRTYSSCESSSAETVNYDYAGGAMTVSNIKASGTKCTFYFDEVRGTSGSSLAESPLTTLTTSADFGKMEPRSGETPAPGLYEFDGMTSGSKTQFYRGAVTNNYVRLGKDSSNYTYWRIVRFDEEENIRLIYDGTSAHDNGEVSNDRVLTTNYDGTNMYTPKYHSTHAKANVKWSNSEIKTYLEGTWMTAFENKLSQKEKLQLTTGKFCSDTNGNASSYGPRTRLETNKTPSFDCASGDLTTARVGMLSADEYSFAGGGGHGNSYVNTSFYLYTGKNWWTLSPYRWDGSEAMVYFVHMVGYLYPYYVTNADCGVRPVIILKGDTLFDLAGEGTKTNPYTIAN